MTAPANFAIHQGTLERQWAFAECIDGLARHGVRALTVRRGDVEEYGADAAARLISDAGLQVLGVSRCASLTESEPARISANHDENLRALEVTAKLGASHLAMICGGLPEGSRDLPGARARARDALERLVPEARSMGVRMGLEPIHPMRVATGCIWSTLAMADAICADLGEGVGIIVDAYHVWWDPRLDETLAAAAGRIYSFQVSDWLHTTGSVTGDDRGMPGDGVIDLRRMYDGVRAAGYDGFVELELFSADNWWTRDPDEVLETAFARHRDIFGDPR
ncbi:MAG: sugar phosphate isomerase/epimerase [Alphaproteobacteria bacterium]|nr:sugar phosphate isomerase/epimerase [Alphaproteobacteria bacterium]